jgi:hypothetical protein
VTVVVLVDCHSAFCSSAFVLPFSQHVCNEGVLVQDRVSLGFPPGLCEEVEVCFVSVGGGLVDVLLAPMDRSDISALVRDGCPDFFFFVFFFGGGLPIFVLHDDVAFFVFLQRSFHLLDP